jgi:hypothetical protein
MAIFYGFGLLHISDGNILWFWSSSIFLADFQGKNPLLPLVPVFFPRFHPTSPKSIDF